MSIQTGFFTSKNAALGEDLKRRAEYIFYTKLNAEGTEPLKHYDSTKIAVLTYGACFILLNTLIPISLIVSLEFVKML